jgi:Kef-type K+ transport system membrane component KefB
MATTAIGTLMPVLRDAKEIPTPFGAFILAAGAVGEFAPIVALAFLSGLDNELATVLVLNNFLLAVIVAVAVGRHWRPTRIVRLLRETLRSSAQLAIRLSIFLLAGFVALAVLLGLDFLLGAFAAGMVTAQTVKTVNADRRDELEIVEHKYEAVGFGLLIPIFFIMSGVTYDLASLLASPVSIALVPVFALAFLFVRGLPALVVYRRALNASDRLALGILSATELPLVIAITGEAVDQGSMSEAMAAAMVGAAMLSVLLFPLAGLSIRRRSAGERQASPVPA